MWFELANVGSLYMAEYVSSSENVADGLSRKKFGYLQSRGAREVTHFASPYFSTCLDEWVFDLKCVQRALF